MYLPGTINERIGDLRTSRRLSQKELADMIGIAPSQLSRIEKGQTQHVSSDILIKLSKALGVSTDYILGLTTISVQKSYDISELGLSEDTVRVLVSKSVDVTVLNRLIAHERFPYMIQMIKSYFDDTIAVGVVTRNDMIDFATSTLGDFAKQNPDDKDEILSGARFFKSQKLGEHEADIEKIKSVFLVILKGIKKDMGDGKVTGDVATAEFFGQVKAELLPDLNNLPSASQVADLVMAWISTQAPLDNESAKQLRGLVEKLFTPPENPSASK